MPRLMSVRSLLKQGCNSEDEDENTIDVQAEIHHESEVADAEIDEDPIVVETVKTKMRTQLLLCFNIKVIKQ